MNPTFSSPASSSHSSSVNTPPKNHSEEHYLVIRKQPPSYVYPKEVFELEFAVEAMRGSQNSPPSGVAVSITLISAKGASKNQHAELTLLEEPRISLSRRTGKARCQLRCSQLSHKHGAAVVLRISTKEDLGITPCTTNAVRLVNAKIRISTPKDWGNIWFKDEGGRDKSLEVMASAYGADNQVIREKIPLRLTLYYSAERPNLVSNQELLRALGSDRKLQIDETTGSAKVRFRIEDVSKNHQGQDFMVEVAADGKEFRDVAPGFTPAVSVRSKRNKRQRQISSGTSVRYPTSGSERGAPSPLLSGRRTSYAEHISLEGMDSNRIREALQGVIQWTEEVVNGLYPLQWQVLGYSQNPDGSPDYNRPYHSMPNPNPLIHRVLSTYTESTRDQLRALQQVLEQAMPARTTAEPFPVQQQQSQPQQPQQSQQRQQQLPIVEQQAVRGRDVPYGGMPPPAAAAMPREPYGTAMYPPQSMSIQEQAYQNFPVQHVGYFPPPSGHAGEMLSGMPSQQPSQQLRQAEPKPPPADTSRESEVEYVLAKQYKSARTGQRLGFPAYSAGKEILGFYRESTTLGAGQFVPITQHSGDFGPLEIMQATEILEEAMANKSDAVHALKDWGSINSLIDHCLVYDFSKDISSSGVSNQPNSGLDLE